MTTENCTTQADLDIPTADGLAKIHEALNDEQKKALHRFMLSALAANGTIERSDGGSVGAIEWDLHSLLCGIATMADKAKRLLNSIEGTLGSDAEDAALQGGIALIEKVGILSDSAGEYDVAGSAEEWLSPYQLREV